MSILVVSMYYIDEKKGLRARFLVDRYDTEIWTVSRVQYTPP